MAFGFGGGPIRRERDGSFTVRLSEHEQLLLKSLLAQLRTLLKLEGGGEITEDSGVRRLFPTAYPGRDDLEAEYQGMVHDDLLGQRLAAIDQVEDTIVLPSVDEEQLGTWMRTFNDLRLVLGTRLDVSEDDTGPIDPDDPEAPAQAAYEYLGWLLENIVNALTGALPPPKRTDTARRAGPGPPARVSRAHRSSSRANRCDHEGPGANRRALRCPSSLISPPSVAMRTGSAPPSPFWHRILLSWPADPVPERDVVTNPPALLVLGPAAAEVDEGLGGAPLEAGVLQLRGHVLEGGRGQAVDVLGEGPHRERVALDRHRPRTPASTAVAGPTASRRRASGVVVCSSMSVASRARIRGTTSALAWLAAASAARTSRHRRAGAGRRRPDARRRSATGRRWPRWRRRGRGPSRRGRARDRPPRGHPVGHEPPPHPHRARTRPGVGLGLPPPTPGRADRPPASGSSSAA